MCERPAYRVLDTLDRSDGGRCDHLLDLNELQLPHCDTMQSVVAQMTTEGLARYPLNPTPEIGAPSAHRSRHPLHTRLLTAIAEHLGGAVTPGNIVVTAGADGALRLLCETFLPDTSTLVPVPNYGRFLAYARATTHSQVDTLPLEVDGDDTTALRRGMRDRTYACVYLSRPNNPLGYTLPADGIAELAAEHPATLFIVDEAYIEFSDAPSVVPLAVERRNVVVTRSFSKCFGLAALRIGYVVAHADLVADRLTRGFYDDKDVTTLAKRAALCALQHATHYLDQAKAMHRECRRLASTRFPVANPDNLVAQVVVRDGMFATVYTRDPALVVRGLARAGYAVRNKHADLPGTVRVTLSHPDVFAGVLDACAAMNTA